MVLLEKMPIIFHSFFSKIQDLELPIEQIATCENCTLCRSNHSPYVNTKCCAYFPHLPNFMVGAVFYDNDFSLKEGRIRLRSLIEKKNGITPYGIIPTSAYLKNNKNLKSKDFWSRPQELLESQLCPYYIEGKCSIWKYRENLCVTYFCSSIGGAAGKAFWKKVNQYLKMAETTLSQYAMLRLGWPPAKIKIDSETTSNLNIEDEQGNINEENYKKLWGDWAGREEEFYIKCYEIVSKVDAKTFKRITGFKREILEAAIRDTQKDFLNNVLPERLILHPKVVSENGEEGFTNLRLGEVSAKIPTVTFPLIRAFNGIRTTVEVFHLGYNVLYNMSEVVDELREKGILIKS